MSFGGFGGFNEEESQEISVQAGKTPTKRVRNIPVTVRTAIESALDAKDAVDLPFIYDVQAKYIEIVGQIESITYDQSSLVCTVDDGTGKITLKQYFEGSFVWAVGALRTGSDPYLSINQIRRITSVNDIAFHIITTCAAHIDIVEEKDGTFGATPMRSFNKVQSSSGQFGSTITTTSSSFSMDNDTGATPIKVAAMSSAQIEDQVYQFLVTGKSTQWGFSKNDCVLKFKSVLTESQVNKAIEQLLDDARIYDTGDEVHFKAIE